MFYFKFASYDLSQPFIFDNAEFNRHGARHCALLLKVSLSHWGPVAS